MAGWLVGWLAEYNDALVVQALQGVLEDPYWEVRYAAVAGLAGQKNAAKRAMSLQALTDPMHWVQKAADNVLQQFRESVDLDAQPALRALANDWRQSEGVRAAAREALAKIEEAWGDVSRGAIAVAGERRVSERAIDVTKGEDGGWRMENGRPEDEATADGEWRMGNGRLEEAEGSGWKRRKEPWWRRLRRR